MFKIEIHAWENKELGLIYLENRAFSEDGDELFHSQLDVITYDGDKVKLEDVDAVEWELIETVYDGYSDYPNDKFIGAIEYMYREKRK